MKTQVIHTGDTHLGRRPYQIDDRADDFVDRLKQVVGYAIRRDVDALVHGGDLFDVADPRESLVEDAIDAFNRLNQPDEGIDIPIYLIHGEHDYSDGETPGVDAVCRESHAERLGHDPVILNDAVAMYGLHNEELRSSGENIANNLSTPPSNTETIVFLHSMAHKYNLPDKPAISISNVVFQAPFDVRLVACSDVHKRKRWTTHQGTPCRYAGSPAKLAKRMWDYEPTAFLYTLFDDGEGKDELLKIDARPHYKAQVEVQPDDNVEQVTNRIFDQIADQDGGEPLSELIDEAMVWVTLDGDGSAVSKEDVQSYLEDYDIFYLHIGYTFEFLSSSI